MVGSAWMPCERPTVGVILCSNGAALERGEQRVDIGDQDIGGAHELHIEAGVEHVRRCHAGMHEARFRPDDFGDVRQEGDDVVFDLGLDGIDAGDVEFGVFALFPNLFGGFFRDDAEFGHGVGRVRLDLEPDAEFRLRRPDRESFRGGNSARLSRCFPARHRRRIADRGDIGFVVAALEHG